MNKKVIELQNAFDNAIEEIKENFEKFKAEILNVDKPELIMHDGKQLKKVEREAEKGDYVRFVRDFGFRNTKAGSFYEVIEDKHYLDDAGSVLDVYGWDGERAVEGVYEVVHETVNRVAKVGERILVTDKDLTSTGYENGDIAKVIGHAVDGLVLVDKWSQRLLESEYEVIIEPEQAPVIEEFPDELTPNEQRGELVKSAKKFVEKYQNDEGIERVIGNSTAMFHFYETDFFVKDDKVTAVVYRRQRSGERLKKPHHVGRALCMPGDVFNADIGKAIALARALEIDVPEEFLNAVQPNVAKGQVVKATHVENVEILNKTFRIAEMSPSFDSDMNGTAFRHTHDPGWLGSKQITIINDTNAIYKEELK